MRSNRTSPAKFLNMLALNSIFFTEKVYNKVYTKLKPIHLLHRDARVAQPGQKRQVDGLVS